MYPLSKISLNYALGKSSVVKVLEEQGVVALNADIVGHQVYQPGEPAYNKVINQ
jgi:dephospho-CoA kinase